MQILKNLSFPGTLARVCGVIAFYLDYKAADDWYREDTESEFEASGIPMARSRGAA
jgi:hypothetical protein